MTQNLYLKKPKFGQKIALLMFIFALCTSISTGIPIIHHLLSIYISLCLNRNQWKNGKKMITKRDMNRVSLNLLSSDS